jgi:hypothetical protein
VILNLTPKKSLMSRNHWTLPSYRAKLSAPEIFPAPNSSEMCITHVNGVSVPILHLATSSLPRTINMQTSH